MRVYIVIAYGEDHYGNDVECNDTAFLSREAAMAYLSKAPAMFRKDQERITELEALYDAETMTTDEMTEYHELIDRYCCFPDDRHLAYRIEELNVLE